MRELYSYLARIPAKSLALGWPARQAAPDAGGFYHWHDVAAFLVVCHAACEKH